MDKNKDLDGYLDHLDANDQRALNAYMDNLNLEDNDELDEYLDHIEEQQNAIEQGPVLQSYVELEPEIQSFQDYTTASIEPVIRKTEEPESPLDVSLLDENYVEPQVDVIRYRDDEKESNNTVGRQKEEQKKIDNFDDFDSVYYIDNVGRKKKSPAAAIIICAILILGAGAYAAYYFTDGFKDFAFLGKQPATEITTEEPVTTEEVTEEATTEEQPGPYATVDYTLHNPHATDATIEYNSNPYSLRFPQEEWPITRDDAGNQREATQEDLYPVITLEPLEGSLNSTNPVPDNMAETQQMTSRYMVLVDMSDDSIVAERDGDVVVNPASMTKILTVLTAADMIEDLDDTFEVPMEAIDYSMTNGCSAVGFLAGEKITVRDMIYGTIVCSGADAAVTLADYCCGSQDAFVDKMNEKVEELGISDTAHFTNVVGVYNEDLHCTMRDMAVILSTAMQNELLRDVLNTRIYQTTADPTILPEDVRKELGISVDAPAPVDAVDGQDGISQDQSEAQNDTSDGVSETEEDQAAEGQAEGGQTEESQPESTEESTTEEIDPGVLLVATEGIQISNWFMRRIEDKDTGGEVLGAKTGFVNAAGFCCASYYKSNSGKEYVCVTGDTYSSWRCIYDHVGIYRSLAK